MATDLVRGSYAGKETYLYYNSGTNETPTWVVMTRARNIQSNRARTNSEVEFHGSDETGSIPGYKTFSGSFEYVRRLGADTVYDALVAASIAGTPIELVHLNGTIVLTASKGWRAPVLLGEFAESASGNDGVVVTIPFVKADCHDADGDQVNYVAFTGTTP